MLLPNVIISIYCVSVGCDTREFLPVSKLSQRYLHWFMPLGLQILHAWNTGSVGDKLWYRRKPHFALFKSNTFLVPKYEMNHLSSVWSFLIIVDGWGWAVVWNNFISIWSRNSFSPAETMKRATSWSAVKSTLNRFLFPSAGPCSLYIYIYIYEIKITNAVQWMRCLSWSTWAHEDTITSTGQAEHAILCQL